MPNVVVVNSDSGSQWLGNITEFDQYSALVDWATCSMEAGRLLELRREPAPGKRGTGNFTEFFGCRPPVK